MHPELHTDLDNLNTVQHSLRNSAKGINDAYDVTVSLTVEVGQYFMTKDTGDFRQFRSVACREDTRPRDDPASQPKGWIQGNMRIQPVLKVTTSFQNFKYGIEIRIWSVGQDISQSWVRKSYGTIKYVVDSFEEENSEIPADPHESQTSTCVVAARSKAKAKPQQGEPVDTTTTIPMHE